MAKRAEKKTNVGDRNTERRNGKAWKKNPKTNRGFSGTDFSIKRAQRRYGMEPQKRNEFGHTIKVVGRDMDTHTIVVCDHPKGFVHHKLGTGECSCRWCTTYLTHS